MTGHPAGVEEQQTVRLARAVRCRSSRRPGGFVTPGPRHRPGSRAAHGRRHPPAAPRTSSPARPADSPRRRPVRVRRPSRSPRQAARHGDKRHRSPSFQACGSSPPAVSPPWSPPPPGCPPILGSAPTGDLRIGIRTRSIVAELDAGDVHRIPDVDACHTQFQVGERDKPWEARYESGWRGHVDRDKWPIELLTNWSAGLSKYMAFPTNAM